MLWLCVGFSGLPLEVFESCPEPFAVAAQHRILMANPAATEQGVSPGLKLATACSLVPELRIAERDPGKEQRLLQQLAVALYRFSPRISVQEPDSLLLEIGASLRLYRGPGRLLRKLYRQLRRRGLSLRLGLGHTPKAATLASHLSLRSSWRCCDQLGQINRDRLMTRLGQLPITRLPLTAKQQEQLGLMGIGCIGELLALPAGALARRFGKPLVQYLGQLQGSVPDPQPAFELPAWFHAERWFADGLADSQMLLFPARRMLGDLAAFLRLRQLHSQGFCWQLQHLDKSVTRLDIRLSRGQSNAAAFLELTRVRFETLRLASKVEALSLHCRDLVTSAPVAGGLFTDPAQDDDEAPYRLLDKLNSRLGEQACFGIAAADSHWPEQAWRKAPPKLAVKAAPATAASPVRPALLFPEPRPVREVGGKLWCQGSLILLSRPERLQGHWWSRSRHRDYFIARHESGTLYWLYQDLGNQRWYLQGLFA